MLTSRRRTTPPAPDTTPPSDAAAALAHASSVVCRFADLQRGGRRRLLVLRAQHLELGDDLMGE